MSQLCLLTLSGNTLPVTGAVYFLMIFWRCMMETKSLKQKCFDIATGAYLSEIPDNWDDLHEEEQSLFVEHNKWEPLEYHSNESVLSNIESLQDDIVQLMEDTLNLKSLDGLDKTHFLVNLRVVHGEHNEYMSCIVESDEEHLAAKQAIYQHARCELVWESLIMAYDCSGEIALIVDSVIPLPNEHAAVLKQYIR
jgi:hypothetical protein